MESSHLVIFSTSGKGDGNFPENPPPPPNFSTPRVLRLQCANFTERVLN